MQYRKKPVVIDAFQYDGDFMNHNGEYYVPDWAVDAFDQSVLYFKNAGELYIASNKGDSHVSVGDYIIKGIVGEIYPCSPDVFEKCYEQL